ncbi:MAG TPA: response regulator transcription factor [Candidatus Ventricola intestinavium]|nr:response regulator transcription factor [Candidatus Ventricola intestinavium]
MSRILLVEDDLSLVDGLTYALAREGFTLCAVRTVEEARRRFEQEGPFDLLLLDVTLPDGTGFDLCSAVRAAGSDVPILFLTAADEETSVVRGLDGGGDDYMTKPFRLSELCSRIRALLRRGNMRRARENCLHDGDLTLDMAAGRALLRGKALDLTGAEYRLLGLLVRNAGQTLTRGTILNALWDGRGDFVDDNTLSVYVRRLREKIEDDPSRPRRLVTVRGIGYRWEGTGK